MKLDLSQTLIKDRYYLKRNLKNINKEELLNKYQKSKELFLTRLNNIPKITYDNTLPIHKQLSKIKELITANQITIICGETGSGKTTQIPKICLELERGVSGLIGHTQPRRLAARTCAERIAEELNSEIGTYVGYKFRFNDTIKPSSYIKIMTDGILLAEIEKDKYLNAYDTIIIDEAHERNLNIDFLLGYLKTILKVRKDLKLIITSATINAKKFSDFFKDKNEIPIIEIEGKTFPVDIWYRPISEEISDEKEYILSVIYELMKQKPGDILIFMPGEKEIRNLLQFLSGQMDINRYEILTLYSRLSTKNQQKIFNPNTNKIRIIISTNVAETSVTVPRILYVIDTGTARIKRYSPRLKVEQLHIEPISMASAKQRTGRCGRIAPGICVRLYSHEDFLLRDEYTAPEILRSSLAAIILKMYALNLGDIEEFPLLEEINHKYINDGLRLLIEIGAINENKTLTKIGQAISKIPIDPKIARIILAGHKFNCINEILIIVSLLSIQDPKDIPFEAKEKAKSIQEKFNFPTSDFITYLNIWNYYQKQKKQNSKTKIKKICQDNFLSYRRMNEWDDLYNQLYDILIENKFNFQSKKILLNDEYQNNNTYRNIHTAILTGLINNVGEKSLTNTQYMNIRNNNFKIFPSSALINKKYQWIVSGQILDTNTLYAINVAKIEPEWIIDATPHLLKYHYFNPRWSNKQNTVIVSRKITIYGLTIIQSQDVNYTNINPEHAREIFIYNALIEQNTNLTTDFLEYNNKLIDEISQLEQKSRKLDILIDENDLFNFYDEKIPKNIIIKNKTINIADNKSFLTWYLTLPKDKQYELRLSREELMKHRAHNVTEELFPKYLNTSYGKFKLSYMFNPNHPLDGITIIVPTHLLNKINEKRLEWLVPGMIREKIQLLIKNLPKEIKKYCIPYQEFITNFLNDTTSQDNSLYFSIINYINKINNIDITDKIDFVKWQNELLPKHSYFNIEVIDEFGNEIETNKNLNELKEKYGKIATDKFSDNYQDYEKNNINDWKNIDISHPIELNNKLTGYLGLEIAQDNIINLKVFDTKDKAISSHLNGTIALMKIKLKDHIKTIKKELGIIQKLAISIKNINIEELKDDFIFALLNKIITKTKLPNNDNEFLTTIKYAKENIYQLKLELNNYLEEISSYYQKLVIKITKHPLKDIIKSNIDNLIYQKFIRNTTWEKFAHIPRYLQSLSLRMDKYQGNIQRDNENQEIIDDINDEYIKITNYYQKLNIDLPNDIIMFKWDIEELKVSLFAQELKTLYPVSVKRLEKKLMGFKKLYQK